MKIIIATFFLSNIAFAQTTPKTGSLDGLRPPVTSTVSFYTCDEDHKIYGVNELSNGITAFCKDTLVRNIEACVDNMDKTPTKICYDNFLVDRKVLAEPRDGKLCALITPFDLVPKESISVVTDEASKKVCVAMAFCYTGEKSKDPLALPVMAGRTPVGCLPNKLGICDKNYKDCLADQHTSFSNEQKGTLQIQEHFRGRKTSK